MDDHWSLAELRGNTAWLDALLLSDYRSIRADGSVWDKKALLARAAKNRGHGSEKLKQFDAWLKTHPMDESVIIHGNVAVLLFSDPQNGRIRGSNIFIRENGRWHALYSQQTGIKQARHEASA
ncbi:MAG TPA: nuclear transport factor 2 family protein [Rhodanobacteraceae bacterium]|nr:nuclear transport factor 2 family protein [Rhodanobacteraceae bacterium]